MQKSIVVIGGSGFASKLKGREVEVPTRFGRVAVLLSETSEAKVYAIRRHGANHDTPPHMVNYKAHIALAKEVDAKAILASTAVGVISLDRYSPGDLILCSDILALNVLLGGKVVTFFDSFADGPHHTDMSHPFTPELNAHLLRAAAELSISLKESAILGATYGPRYETAAEIRALKILGADLVGMTAAFEAILAREQGTPYTAVAIGTNPAAGLTGKPLSHDEVIEMMSRRGDDIHGLLMKAIEIV
ncbi:MTAP family purine nucleoside phosphorylase [Candidatus Micrarchaeota archaeon]|nr:MTAP family purine nucleoside phosphorylase [Candidatus Micrarchaeota archaeon]